jgi:two-component system cell cycle sensor histidine kinase/response regulator CckA
MTTHMTLPLGGTLGTILLVEDHSSFRKLVKRILEEANFTVIAASSAKQAIRLEAEFPGTIDLLLLGDVRVTGMPGPDLAEKLSERRPQLRVMLMSEYQGGTGPLLHYGWHYIEKPFAATVLVRKIQDICAGCCRKTERRRARLDAARRSARAATGDR